MGFGGILDCVGKLFSREGCKAMFKQLSTLEPHFRLKDATTESGSS